MISGSASAADGPSGSLRFCKGSGYIEPAQTNIDKATLRFPALLLVDDWGPENGSFDARWPLAILTSKPFELTPRARCITVPAFISPLSKVRSVAPADHRHLEIEGTAHLDGTEDDDTDVPGLSEPVTVVVQKTF